MARHILTEWVARTFLVSFAAYVALHFVPGYWPGIVCVLCAGVATFSGMIFLLLTE